MRNGLAFLSFSSIFLLSNIARATNVPMAEHMNAQLGDGYGATQDLFKGACVTGTVKKDGKPEASVEFSSTISRETLASQLGFDVAGQAQLGAIHASLSVDFMKASTSDAYSVSAIYSGSYKFQDDVLVDLHEAPMVRPLLDTRPTGHKVINNTNLWKDTCGDEFVVAREYGAKLFFSIRIDFKSQSDKSAFNSKFTISGPLFSTSAGLKKASSDFRTDARVTVSAYQMGGDVAKLTSIFQTKGSVQGNNDGATAFVSCSLGKFDDCQTVLANALKYATDTQSGFASQLNSSSNYALLAVRTKPYSHMGIYNENAEAEAGYKDARRTLLRLFNENLNLSIQASRLLEKPIFRLSPRQTKVIKDVDSLIKLNLGRLVDASKNCFFLPRECINELAVFNGQNPLAEVDSKVFNIDPETFAQFCDLGLSSCASEEEKQTVAVLISKAKEIRAYAFANNDDQCGVAEDVLSKEVRLNLKKMPALPNTGKAASSGVGKFTAKGNTGAFVSVAAVVTIDTAISNVSAIASLTQLEELDLEGNNIVDASPLKALVNLKKLNLKKNKVTNLTGFENLINLEQLDISDNKVQSVGMLTKLPKLKVVQALNNNSNLSRPNDWPSSVALLSHGFESGYSTIDLGPAMDPSIGFRPESYSYGDSFEGSVQKLENDRALIVDKYGKMVIMDAHGACRLLTINMQDPSSPKAGSVCSCFENTLGKITRRSICSVPLNNEQSYVTCKLLNGPDWGKKGVSFLFDQKQETCTLMPNTLEPRIGETITPFSHEGKDYVLFTGGRSPTTGSDVGLSSAEIFDLESQKYTLLEDTMVFGRHHHQAVALHNGEILITGGIIIGRDQPVSKAEIFNPKDRTFRRIGDTNVPRIYHQMTVLLDGKVLITGGSHTEFSVEIYDPVTENFTLLKEKPKSDLWSHSSTLLEDGTVLLIARDKDTKPFAEIYEPITQKFHKLSAGLKFSRGYWTKVIPMSQGRALILGEGSNPKISPDGGDFLCPELFCYPNK